MSRRPFSPIHDALRVGIDPTGESVDGERAEYVLGTLFMAPVDHGADIRDEDSPRSA